jgi:hypothetical protein
MQALRRRHEAPGVPMAVSGLRRSARRRLLPGALMDVAAAEACHRPQVAAMAVPSPWALATADLSLHTREPQPP